MAKKAKVRVTGNYVSRARFDNSIDEILNLPIDFTMSNIVNSISSLQYAESYCFGKIEILCTYDE